MRIEQLLTSPREIIEQGKSSSPDDANANAATPVAKYRTTLSIDEMDLLSVSTSDPLQQGVILTWRR